MSKTAKEINNNTGRQLVFKAGKYPQVVDGQITMVDVPFSMLQEVAANYNKAYHFAPVWIGHPYFDAPAVAWVEAVVAEITPEVPEGGLFVELTQYDKLKEMVASGDYKKCSVEFYKWAVGWYFGALGVTNMPLVKGLPELRFSQDAVSEKMMIQSDNNFKFSQTQNIPPMALSDGVKKLATDLKIEFSENDTDEKIINLATTKFQTQSNELSNLKASVQTDKETAAKELIAQAVKDGKLKEDSEQAKSLKAFALDNYSVAKTMIDGIPVNPVLAQDVVPDGTKINAGETTVNTTGEKTVDFEGKKISFQDVIADSKLMERLPQTLLDKITP
jgi:hypothetical protein